MKHDAQGFLVGTPIGPSRSAGGATTGVAALRSLSADVSVIRSLLESGRVNRMRRGTSATTAQMSDRGSSGRSSFSGSGRSLSSGGRGAAAVATRDVRGRFVARASSGPGGSGVVDPTGARSNGPVDRDVRGRFSGGGGSGSTDFAGGGGALGKIAGALGRIGDSMANSERLDPTLEAMKEVRDAVSPVGRGIMSLGARLAERKKEGWYQRIIKAIKGRRGKDEGLGGGGGDAVRSGSLIGTLLGGLMSRAAAFAMPILSLAGGMLLKGAGLLGAFAIGTYIGGKIYQWLDESGIATKIFDAFDAVKAWASAKLDEVAGGVKRVTHKISSEYEWGRDTASGRLDGSGRLVADPRRVDRPEKSIAGMVGAAAGTISRISGLLGSKGKTRTYARTDGATETRVGGTVSWRNNNPGNLKFEHAGSADKTVRSKRTRAQALAAARARYAGVVDLDQWGNAIFASEEQGRAAQAQLLRGSHGGKTVESMLPKYAMDDYTGKANHAAYAARIHKMAESKGLNLRGKRIGDMTQEEMGVLMDGMKKVEGYRAGTVTTTGIPASPIASAKMPGPLSVNSVSVPMSVPDKTPVAQVASQAERLGGDKPQTLSAVVRGDIGQDVRDRSIAHNVSGGIGGNGG